MFLPYLAILDIPIPQTWWQQHGTALLRSGQSRLKSRPQRMTLTTLALKDGYLDLDYFASWMDKRQVDRYHGRRAPVSSRLGWLPHCRAKARQRRSLAQWHRGNKYLTITLPHTAWSLTWLTTCDQSSLHHQPPVATRRAVYGFVPFLANTHHSLSPADQNKTLDFGSLNDK